MRKAVQTITYRNWYLFKCKILRSNGVRIAGEQVVNWTRRDMVRETRQVGIVSRLGAKALPVLLL